VGIALLAVAVRFYLLFTTHSTAEDFYITLRYAENLARGDGFVYNPGERVLGTTTPLYALFLALAVRIGLDPILLGKSVNILADGVSCLLAYRLARITLSQASTGHRASGVGRWESRSSPEGEGIGVVAAALLALSPPNLTWAISGMETALVTMTGLAVFVALAERRPLLMAFCAAALALLRIDGLLLVLVAFASLGVFSVQSSVGSTHHAPRNTQYATLLRAALLFLLLILPWTLFAAFYFGSPIPTSAVAKWKVYAWYSQSTLPNLAPFFRQMTHTKLHWALLAGVVLSLFPSSLQRKKAEPSLHPLLPAALWLLLYYASMALSQGFLFGWYYIPPSPIYFLLAVTGWNRVIRWLGNRAIGNPTAHRLFPSSPLPLFILLAIVTFGLRALPGVRAQIADAQDVENRLRRPIGEVLRALIPPGKRLMLEPIGYIGYFSGARVLDAVGLVSPEVIPYFRKGAVSPYLDILAAFKPEYVLLRTGEYHDALNARVPPDRALLAHYELVRVFPDPAAPPEADPAFFLLRRKTGIKTPVHPHSHTPPLITPLNTQRA